MKLIPLTQGKFAKIDDSDFESVSQFSWCAAKRGRGYYADRKLNYANPHRALHSFLMNPPKGMQVHHMDGDGLNNQRSNLRIVTRRQNNQGFVRLRVGKKSIFRGVTWNRKKKLWIARITTSQKRLYLGSFKREEDAASAYNEAALRNFWGVCMSEPNMKTVKVFIEGSPGGGMWAMPLETWSQIQRGAIEDVDGLFITVAAARRLLAEQQPTRPHQSGSTTFISDQWCGSEGGTPRQLPPIEAEPNVIDEATEHEIAENESQHKNTDEN